MVRQVPTELDTVFGMLADPTRRAILARLTEGDAYVTELAAPHDMSLAAVSRHLHALEGAGLMVREKEGRKVRCRLNARPLKDAADWLTFYRRFWEHSFDALDRFIDRKDPPHEEDDQ